MHMIFEGLDFLSANFQLLILGAVVIALYALEVRWILKRQDAWKRKKKEAAAAGRTIMGTRIKLWEDVSEEFQDRRTHAIYEYEADGKKYRKGVSSKYSDPPETLLLYYTKSPKKVFSDYDDNHNMSAGILLPVFFFLPLAVVYLFAKLLGVDLEMLKNI